ncbi:MAG: FkbM family methyltransferase [Planctomycetota bacterium]|nr:FkbM family methyltransferase [Planctomycetota bacterium]
MSHRTRSLKQVAYNKALALYRASPLHPHLSASIAKFISAVQGERDVTRDLPDFRMSLNTAQWIDSTILMTGTFEPTTTALIRRALKPGMTAVDVGANIGWLTLTMAHAVQSTGKVWAFEPSDWTFARLQKNIALNTFEHITAVRAAVGDSNGSLELMFPCGYRLDGTDTATRQNVDLVSLDTVLEGKTIDLLKVDTDGSELEVIMGANNLIQTSRPVIVFEVMARTPKDKLHSLAQLLSDSQYAICSEAFDPVDDFAEFVSTIATGTANLIAATPDKIATLQKP